MGRKEARLGAAIVRGPSTAHTKSIQRTADQYVQQRQAPGFATAWKQDRQQNRFLSQPAPKPQLVPIQKGSTGSIRPEGLRVKPSQPLRPEGLRVKSSPVEDLQAQVNRLIIGRQACCEICGRQTAAGVYGGLVSCDNSCFQRLFSQASLKINDQVDWLVADCFDDVSSSGPAWVFGEKTSDQQQQQQQCSSAAQDMYEPTIKYSIAAQGATPAMKIQLPGCSRNKAKANNNNNHLGKACRRLVGGFVKLTCMWIATKTASRVLTIKKPAA